MSYFKKLKKTFREFKLIEIKDPQTVEVHITYIHPFYGSSQYYRVCFSEDLQLMFIRLPN